jgi:hypothetical protein
MIHEHQLRTITQNNDGYIAYCDGCKKYNVAYKNSLLIFTELELDAFKQLLENRIGIYSFTTTHGKELFLKTPLSNLFILFTEAELKELVDMISKVNFLLNAHVRANSNQN